MKYGIANWKKHLVDSIDTQGFEDCEYYTDSQNDSDLLRFTYNRFMSEKGWQVKKDDLTVAVNDWLSGLALDIAFENHDILKLGQQWGELGESPSQDREEYFIQHWFNNLTWLLIDVRKKEGLVK